MSDTMETTEQHTKKKQWSDFTPVQRVSIVVIGTIEVLLTLWALVDLVRRPTRRLRGTKLFWLPAVFIQPLGPVAYLVLGRKD